MNKMWLVVSQDKSEMQIVECATAVGAAYDAHLKSWLVRVHELPRGTEYEQVWRVKPA